MDDLSRAIVGVIGGGTMGAGIVQMAAQAGHEVRLFDAAEGAAAKGKAGIAAIFDRLIEKGRMSAGERDGALARIIICDDIGQLAGAGLVIEAVIEDLAIKRGIFQKLEAICSPETLLASNTSSLSITAIAAGLVHKGRFMGLHFFNPAPLMKLVEIVAGLASDNHHLDRATALMKRWGKVPVRATSTPGFIVNRIARPFYGEALRLAEAQVADVATIDALMRSAGGFRMGPFELMDLIGMDVNLAVTGSVWEACYHDPRYAPSVLQAEMVAGGFLGRKSGRGFYDHGRKPPAPVLAKPAPPPRRIRIGRSLGAADGLAHVIEQAGLPVTRTPDPDGWLEVDGVRLALTDGRLANERGCALFDLAHDYAAASHMALAVPDSMNDADRHRITGLFQALGMAVSLIADSPGLVVARTVAMIINEAAEAVQTGICSAADADLAMRLGVNYPRGPLEWGDELGSDTVLSLLDHLGRLFPDGRYRPCLRLRHSALAGTPLTR